MPQRKKSKCCWYYDLQVGTMVIGAVCIVMAFLGFLVTFKLPVFWSIVDEISAMSYIRPISDVLVLTTSAFLIYGARTRKIKYLLPWMLVMSFIIPLSAVMAIVHLPFKNYGNFVYQTLVTGFLLHFWFEVFLFIRELRLEAKEEDGIVLSTMATSRRTRKSLRNSMLLERNRAMGAQTELSETV